MVQSLLSENFFYFGKNFVTVSRRIFPDKVITLLFLGKFDINTKKWVDIVWHKSNLTHHVLLLTTNNSTNNSTTISTTIDAVQIKYIFALSPCSLNLIRLIS